VLADLPGDPTEQSVNVRLIPDRFPFSKAPKLSRADRLRASHPNTEMCSGLLHGGSNGASGIAGDDRVRLDVAGNDTSCADDGALADRHPG